MEVDSMHAAIETRANQLEIHLFLILGDWRVFSTLCFSSESKITERWDINSYRSVRQIIGYILIGVYY